MKEVIHSKMTFHYDESDCFEIENSKLCSSLGTQTVEFVWYKREKDVLLLIEAKESFSNPNPPEPPVEGKGFYADVEDIYGKFTHSIDLFFAVILKRQKDEMGEVPHNLKNLQFENVPIRLLLIINGHEKSWCIPIKDELNKRLKRHIKTWNLEVGVLNDTTAIEWGLVSSV